MHIHVKGVLANGTHTFTDLDHLGLYLTGAALLTARRCIRAFGSVMIKIKVDYVPLAIEPHDFGEERAPELICRIPPGLLDRVVRPRVRTSKRGKKLTDDEREYIRLSGESLQTLADRYGVSRQAISQVRNYVPRCRSKGKNAATSG